MTRNLADQLKNLGISGKGINQFDIFTIPDDIIGFPEERLGQHRKKHENRPVIVLQGNKDNSDPLIKIVLVAPLSTSPVSNRLDYLLHKKKSFFSTPKIVY